MGTEVQYGIQEDILYLYESHPVVTRVCFRGKLGCWDVRSEDTYRPAKALDETGVGMAIWLDVLPADTYDLYVWLGDELQDTGKKITKQK